MSKQRKQHKQLLREPSIIQWFSCGECLKEIEALKLDVSPAEYANTQAGFTKQGLQVWCNRHNLSVVHIDFRGQKVELV